MNRTFTYTTAALEVSARTYDEIAGKLRAAGYDHAFDDRGEIDMHGIALMREQLLAPQVPAPARWWHRLLRWGAPVSQGLCDTTATERFVNPRCSCATYTGNLGPCYKFFEMGANGRCAFCDHERACHPHDPRAPLELNREGFLKP